TAAAMPSRDISRIVSSSSPGAVTTKIDRRTAPVQSPSTAFKRSLPRPLVPALPLCPRRGYRLPASCAARRDALDHRSRRDLRLGPLDLIDDRELLDRDARGETTIELGERHRPVETHDL